MILEVIVSVVVAVADTPQKEGAGIFGAPLTKYVLKRIYPVIGQLSKPERKYYVTHTYAMISCADGDVHGAI